MIVVTTGNAQVMTTFDVENGKSWHVDDFNRLHVMDVERKPLATFAPGTWIAAEQK